MKNQMTVRRLKPMKETGSFINMMMGVGGIPKVGEGATEMSWTDRHPYVVTWVAEDLKSCKVQPVKVAPYNHYDGHGKPMLDQPDGPERTLYFKWGAWRQKSEQINWIAEEEPTEEVLAKYGIGYAESMWGFDKVVKGITKKVTEWPVFKIRFGVADHYYDPHF